MKKSRKLDDDQKQLPFSENDKKVQKVNTLSKRELMKLAKDIDRLKGFDLLAKLESVGMTTKEKEEIHWGADGKHVEMDLGERHRNNDPKWFPWEKRHLCYFNGHRKDYFLYAIQRLLEEKHYVTFDTVTKEQRKNAMAFLEEVKEMLKNQK